MRVISETGVWEMSSECVIVCWVEREKRNQRRVDGSWEEPVAARFKGAVECEWVRGCTCRGTDERPQRFSRTLFTPESHFVFLAWKLVRHANLTYSYSRY